MSVAQGKWANEQIAQFFKANRSFSLSLIKNERFDLKFDERIPNPAQSLFFHLFIPLVTGGKRRVAGTLSPIKQICLYSLQYIFISGGFTMIRLLYKNEAIRQFMANLSRVDVNKVFPIQKMLTFFAFQQLSLKIHINKNTFTVQYVRISAMSLWISGLFSPARVKNVAQEGKC